MPSAGFEFATAVPEQYSQDRATTIDWIVVVVAVIFDIMAAPGVV
jgi:hypothetical protein